MDFVSPNYFFNCVVLSKLSLTHTHTHTHTHIHSFLISQTKSERSVCVWLSSSDRLIIRWALLELKEDQQRSSEYKTHWCSCSPCMSSELITVSPSPVLHTSVFISPISNRRLRNANLNFHLKTTSNTVPIKTTEP